MFYLVGEIKAPFLILCNSYYRPHLPCHWLPFHQLQEIGTPADKNGKLQKQELATDMGISKHGRNQNQKQKNRIQTELERQANKKRNPRKHSLTQPDSNGNPHK
jgi:hypothetical protein